MTAKPLPELLPCPFCGGQAAFVPRAVNIALQKDPSDPKFGVSVICGQCSSECANMVDEEHAARKWNTRTPSAGAGGSVGAEPVKRRMSEKNHLVYVADPLSSTACRGVFVNDVTPWWWDAGLVYERQSAAADKGLSMRATPAPSVPLGGVKGAVNAAVDAAVDAAIYSLRDAGFRVHRAAVIAAIEAFTNSMETK